MASVGDVVGAIVGECVDPVGEGVPAAENAAVGNIVASVISESFGYVEVVDIRYLH